MSPRKHHTLSSVQILILLMVGIALAAVAAVMFAPKKAPAPPVSRMSVEERPAERVAQRPDTQEASEPEPVVATVAPAPSVAPASEPELATVATGDYTVEGVVTDVDSGEPVAGIQVFLLDAAAGAIHTATEGQITALLAEGGDSAAVQSLKRDCVHQILNLSPLRGITDGSGRYRIAATQAGDYRIWLPGRDYLAQQSRYIQDYGASLGALSDDRPTLTHDAKVKILASIAGRVTEMGTSTGAPDLQVVLLDASAKDSLGKAQTAEDGSYEIAVPKLGDYAVRVELAGSAYRLGQVVPFRRVNVTATNSMLKGVDFEVDPAGVVWGYVTTPGGEPVPGSEVVLTTSESPLTQFITAALRRTPPISSGVQEDGYYELLGVPLNEEFQVFAQATTQTPQLAPPFVLTPQIRSLRVDVYMFPGSRISGTVVDPSGRRIPDARIRMIPSLTSLASPLTSAVAFRDARSDGNGDFVIAEVPAGTYGIYAQQQGYKFDTAGVPIYPDGYTDMTGVNVVLYPIEAGVHQIFGKVVDMAGEGLSGVDVQLNGLALDSMTRIEQATTTSASGEFRFTDVPSGRYGGIFSKEAYGTVRRTGLALDRENKIQMTQSSLVRGRVLVRETNAAPPQYTVQALKTASYGDERQTVTRTGNEQMSGSFANPDGSFELYLGPGDYQLTATSQDLTPGRTQVSVEPGSAMDDVTIYVSETGASISGTVTTMDRKSPQGATARLVDTSGGIAAALEGGGPISTEYVVGEDGAFRFERLPAGTYIINVEHPTYAKASSESITLAEGETRDGIEIQLGSGGVLTGTVCKNDGTPWPNAQVFVGSADSATLRDATTDENGYFQLDGLATGEYTVTAASFTGIDVLGSERPARSVYVTDGQTATVDFCSPGIRLQGICSPPPPQVLGGGQVVLTPLGRPSMQELSQGNESNLFRMVVGGGNSVDSQGFYEVGVDVPGVYQFEVIYFSLIPGGGEGGAVEIVFSSLIELSGDQPVVQFDVEVSPSN